LIEIQKQAIDANVTKKKQASGVSANESR